MVRVEKKAKILIADDEESVLFAVETILNSAGSFNLHFVKTGRETLLALQSGAFDVALLDLQLPDMNGIDIIKKAKADNVLTEIVMITGHASINTAVKAIQSGAYNYLQKPVDSNELVRVVEQALKNAALIKQNRYLQSQVDSLTRYQDIIGKSAPMQELFQTLEAVAGSDASVLISGDSGTGKELVAHAVHQRSPRKDGPFIAVNCAALPATILESELFGHEKGSFTGAVKDKKGLFSQANGGTIFLDELAEMPFELQAKLLRVLETGVFRSVGGQNETKVDVRALAATNKNPQKAVEENKLREDLYYRLAVVEVELPPLRDRIEDIPLLASDFLQRFAKAAGKKITGFPIKLMEFFMNYEWPGNVRELQNILQRFIVLKKYDFEDLFQLKEEESSDDLKRQGNGRLDLRLTLKEYEKNILLKALNESRWNRKKAAEILNIPLRTLSRKIKEYGLV